MRRILLNNDEIQSIVKRLAAEIANDFENELFVVTVLEGARVFSERLVKELQIAKNISICNDCIKLSSYNHSTESNGGIALQKDLSMDLAGRDVLVVEDIVDTGCTMSFLKNYLLTNKRARSVKVCSLLDKPARRKVPMKLDYVGSEVPDVFVVGFGIDFAGRYRELPYVAEVNTDSN